MKVAIISEPYVPIPPIKYGGTEAVVSNLIKGLIELGHEPILLAPGDSTIDCEVIPITPRSIFFPRDPKKLPSFQNQIAQVRRNTALLLRDLLPRVDVIHSMGFDIKDFADFPHVYTLHGQFLLDSTNQLERIDYFLDRRELNYVSISNNQRNALPQLNYIATVYNGEDPSQFPVVLKPQKYLCFIGRFDHHKNPHLAIELALKKQMKIKLAGKIDFVGRDYFNQMVKPMLKHPLVEYLGELNFKDKVKLMSHAAANLHPTSWREPFGLTIIESGYSGTPTLAISRGSMPELITDTTGALVEDFVEGYWVLDKVLSLDRARVARRTRYRFNYLRMTRGYVKAYKNAIKLAQHESHLIA